MPWQPTILRNAVLGHAKSLRWPVGSGIVLLVITARLLGLFSRLELLTLDSLLSYRFHEPQDPHITIVGLDAGLFR